MCFSPQRRATFRHRNFKKCSETVSFLTFWRGNVLLKTAACNFSTSELQKAARDRQFFNISWKCASRHSVVQFFDIGTSKSGPKLTCFVHFDFKMCLSPQRRAIFRHRNFKKCSENVSFFSILVKMCLSPQRRAIFRHRNFKKCSENVSFLAFWLENVLLATTACNFWFLLWPHDSAPAALTSLLFDSPDTRIIGKTQHFATSLTFGVGESSFFWLYFLLTLLHLSAFHLLFNSPYCRKFTI